MLNIILINGVKRVGKDSFVAFFNGFTSAEDSVYNVSTIDGIRDGLTALGINVDDKTDETRNLLAAVGDKAERDTNAKTYYTLRQISQIATVSDRDAEVYVFVHVREPDMIRNLSERIKSLFSNIRVTTLLIRNPVLEEIAGAQRRADDIKSITAFDYDHIISATTMHELQENAKTFLFILLQNS